MHSAKDTTTAQVAQLKPLIAAAVVQAGKYPTEEEFHADVEFSIAGADRLAKKPWWQADCYLSRYFLCLSDGGYRNLDEVRAEACKIAKQCGITVRE